MPSLPCSSTPVRAVLSRALKYLTDDNAVFERVPLSIYVIADFDSEDGLGMLQAALAFSVRHRSCLLFVWLDMLRRIPLLHYHA